VALGVVGTAASAGQTTGTLPASITVFTGCSLVTRPLTFDATVITGNNPIDATTTITVKCTPNTNFTVDIDNGLNASGNSSNRQMRSATGGLLAYDVYRDSPRTSGGPASSRMSAVIRAPACRSIFSSTAAFPTRARSRRVTIKTPWSSRSTSDHSPGNGGGQYG